MERILSLQDLIIKLRLDEEQVHDLMTSELGVIKSFIENNGYKVSRRTVIEIRDLYWYEQPEYDAVKSQILMSFDHDLSRTANVEVAWLLIKAKVRDWWRWVALFKYRSTNEDVEVRDAYYVNLLWWIVGVIVISTFFLCIKYL